MISSSLSTSALEKQKLFQNLSFLRYFIQIALKCSVKPRIPNNLALLQKILKSL